ncbi:unnamed protein product [Hymenolepis diminuta]|uniref:Uncharacterized protein n=1 Tax=Hymenolepis diminuta TaxID=6216 RepID=A0A564XXU3_HYMDI|nr:unnamed protein product [Hymenolepis diminuta]
MNSADLTYEEITNKLGSAVGENSFLLNLTICEGENAYHYVDIVNRLYTSLRFGSLEKNQFKCPCFILVLQPPFYAEIQLRFLSLLDKELSVKKSRREPESSSGLLIVSVQP